ncbi:MAG: hypothetical protein IJX54_04855 [Oscillospiraceae bacterium]|nr:hypothetical protein [Oscillospiraceae bacterium]
MGKFWKVLAGLGVAAATAGVVLSLAKKKNEEVYDEFDLEEDLCEGCEDENCDACKCEDCACEDDCSECECDEDCEECDCYIDFEEADEEDIGLDIKDAVNSVIDGVMGGIVIAADKVSELAGKLADTVSNKLVERQEAAMFDMDDCDFDCDCEECEDECCCGCCGEACEEACEVVVETCGDVSDAIEEAAEAVEEAVVEATEETAE